MKKQKPVDFSFVDDYENSPQAKFFQDKINSASSIEVAVLFGHVFMQDLLWDLLTLRLRADARPERIPGFETLVGLTLAGCKFETEREILASLNRARNEVGHRIQRRGFDDAIRRFCELLWNVEHEGMEAPSRTTPFRWPNDESSQILVFRAALMTLIMHLPALISAIPR